MKNSCLRVYRHSRRLQEHTRTRACVGNKYYTLSIVVFYVCMFPKLDRAARGITVRYDPHVETGFLATWTFNVRISSSTRDHPFLTWIEMRSPCCVMGEWILIVLQVESWKISETGRQFMHSRDNPIRGKFMHRTENKWLHMISCKWCFLLPVC